MKKITKTKRRCPSCGKKYVHIDELPIAKLYKPGQVMFAKREAEEWKYKPTPIELEKWRGQMLGGLRVSDWDKPKTNN